MHPAPPDVERVAPRRVVDPAEAEPALGVLEGPQPLRRPSLEHERIHLADRGARRVEDLLSHRLEAGVRMVDVPLLQP